VRPSDRAARHSEGASSALDPNPLMRGRDENLLRFASVRVERSAGFLVECPIDTTSVSRLNSTTCACGPMARETGDVVCP
jgi:hypothetical protein